MTLKKLFLIFNILMLLSVSLILAQEPAPLTDEQFQTELAKFKDTNDPTILSDNIQRLTPEQQQTMINEIKQDFWRNWEEEQDQSKKQNVWQNLDPSERANLNQKFGEEYGSVKVSGFDENTNPGSGSVLGNSKVYVQGTDFKAHNKAHPENPITDMTYEKTANGHILKVQRKTGSTTLQVGDNQRGYFFDPESNRLLRVSEEGLPDTNDPLSGRSNGKGDLIIDATKDQIKISMKYVNEDSKEYAKFTTTDGTIVSNFRKPARDNEGERIYELNEASITFNEDGSIDQLSDAYLKKGKNQFFAGKDTQYIGSKEKFEELLKNNNGQIPDKNILVYDPNFEGKNGKKGFLLQNAKGRSFFDDFTPILAESFSNGKIELLQGLKDIDEGKFDTDAVKLLREKVEGIGTKIDNYKDLNKKTGFFDKINAKTSLAEISSTVFDEAFIKSAKKELKDNPTSTKFTNEQLDALGIVLKNSFYQLGLSDISDVSRNALTEQDPELAISLGKQLVAKINTFENSIISQQSLDLNPALSRYQRGFMNAEIGENLAELRVNGGKVFNNDLIIKGSPTGVSIGKLGISNPSSKTFNIDNVNSDFGTNSFTINSDQFGRINIDRRGKENIIFGNTNFYESANRAELYQGAIDRIRSGDRGFLEKVFDSNGEKSIGITLAASGSPIYIGNTKTYVGSEDRQRLIELYNSKDPEDRKRYFAKLGISDYAISMTLNPQSLYGGDGRVSSSITQKAIIQKNSAFRDTMLPKLQTLKAQLETQIDSPVSLSSTSPTNPGLTDIINDFTSISKYSIDEDINSELTRGISGLISEGQTFIQVKNKIIDETIGTIDFISNRIKQQNGNINQITYDGGSGLYELQIDGVTRTSKNPDISPALHAIMPKLLETVGFKSGNIIQDDNGKRLLYPGSTNIHNIKNEIGNIISNPSRLNQVSRGSTQIQQGSQQRTYQYTNQQTGQRTQTTQSAVRYNKNSPRYFGRTGQMKYKRDKAKGLVR